MNNKRAARLRRARRARLKIRQLGVVRLTVHRSANHMYAQLIDSQGSKVLAQASTLEADLKSSKTGNVEAAKKVGVLIAERAKETGNTKVAFDRAGYKYHGRVKALAESARESGLEF